MVQLWHCTAGTMKGQACHISTLAFVRARCYPHYRAVMGSSGLVLAVSTFPLPLKPLYA